MEVEFVLRPDDILALNEYVWDHPTKRMKDISRGLWLVLVLFGLLTLLTIPSFIRGDWVPHDFLAPLLFVGLLIGKLFRRRFLRGIVRRSLDQKADQNAKQLGWKRVTLTPEAITDASEGNTQMIAWTEIEKIVIAGERALCFNSPTSACIVPQRAFADENAFREFVATARAYRDMTRHAPREGMPNRRQDVPEPDTNITPDGRADH